MPQTVSEQPAAFTAPTPPRQRMLDAVLEASGELGYDQVAVRHIIQRSGAGRRTFYRHFDDKTDCFEAAYADAIERLSGQLIATAQAESDWREALRASLGTLLRYLDDHRAEGRALFVEVHVAGGQALVKRVEVMTRLGALLDQIRPELTAHSAPPVLTANAVLGGIDTAIRARLAEGQSTLLPLLPELMHFAVLPYLGPEAAVAELAGDSVLA